LSALKRLEGHAARVAERAQIGLFAQFAGGDQHAVGDARGVARHSASSITLPASRARTHSISGQPPARRGPLWAQ
jgi:hypothetical protein